MQLNTSVPTYFSSYYILFGYLNTDAFRSYPGWSIDVTDVDNKILTNVDKISNPTTSSGTYYLKQVVNVQIKSIRFNFTHMAHVLNLFLKQVTQEDMHYLTTHWVIPDHSAPAGYKAHIYIGPDNFIDKYYL